jgi:hypothetical protein
MDLLLSRGQDAERGECRVANVWVSNLSVLELFLENTLASDTC